VLVVEFWPSEARILDSLYILGRTDIRYHNAPRGYGILQPAGLMHKLALWVEHAASDVLFVETRHASGMSTVARCPDLVGDDSRGDSRDTHTGERK
jgi:hypothetical protein